MVIVSGKMYCCASRASSKRCAMRVVVSHPGLGDVSTVGANTLGPVGVWDESACEQDNEIDAARADRHDRARNAPRAFVEQDREVRTHLFPVAIDENLHRSGVDQDLFAGAHPSPVAEDVAGLVRRCPARARRSECVPSGFQPFHQAIDRCPAGHVNRAFSVPGFRDRALPSRSDGRPCRSMLESDRPSRRRSLR